MADMSLKWEDNLPGKYYIDKNCIFCNLCIEVAPAYFKESNEGDHDIVIRQPVTEEEISLFEEAKVQCPVDSIGNDGE